MERLSNPPQVRLVFSEQWPQFTNRRENAEDL